MRFAHSEGHTDVCFDESGEHVVTCGSDGDVHIYQGFEDGDPISHRIGDAIYCVACKNQRIYVASDKNAVEAYTFTDGQPDGILTRFSGHGTHMCLNNSGSCLIAGASDFVVKVIDVGTCTQKVLLGHSGPVLSVCLDPTEQSVASSSCDGTVHVWDIASAQKRKIIDGLPVSNDFSTSKTLCRLVWDRNGKYLYIPMGKLVVAYDTKTWSIAFELTDSFIKELLSVLCQSASGRYIAASSIDGLLLIWDLSNNTCIARHKHEKKLSITGLAWHPHKNEIVYCDGHGFIGCYRLKDESLEMADLFDDSDEKMMMHAAEFDDIDDDGAIPGIDTDVSEDADELPVTNNNIHGVAAPLNNISELSSRAEVKDVDANHHWESTFIQEPFQSGSSPVSLSSRFMVWNNIGIIIQYNTEEEQSINVEFHDIAVHHAMHINNSVGHTMADLSSSAVLLASESSGENPSHLVCMHFGSWDNAKEWSVSMPEGEDIKAVCLGQNWLAVVTDRRLVRIFSIAGVQLQIFSLPGPVVSVAAHRDKFIVIYHSGQGLPGDQCLSFRLVSVDEKFGKSMVDHLPISARSTLIWLGFSAEGRPFCADSHGIIRMLNYGFGNTWIEVANLRSHCKGKLDHMWIVGICENPQQLRAVLCKGAKYPPVLPQPTVQILPFSLPFCDMSADKGMLEEQLWRTTLFSDQIMQLASNDLSFNESDRLKLTIAKQEILMKLFALACKSGREVRATELCHLMPSSRTVQLAIKYSSRLHLIQLAERLGKVAQLKTEEENISLNNVDSRDSMQGIDLSGMPPQNKGGPYEQCLERSKMTDEVLYKSDEVCETDCSEAANSHSCNPSHSLLLIQKTESSELASRTISDSQSDIKNPFRICSNLCIKTPVLTKGSRVFDDMGKQKQEQSNVLKSKTAQVLASTDRGKKWPFILAPVSEEMVVKRRKLNSSKSNNDKQLDNTGT